MTALLRRHRTYQELPAWGTAEDPPKEFRLFPYGKTTGTSFAEEPEEIYLTPEDAKAIVAEWKRRGIKGVFDFNHELKEAGGTFSIEARDDGLWLVDIKWNPSTREAFKDGKWIYNSPYFATEKRKDGKNYIVALLNDSITNFPKTDNQRPLIALSQRNAMKELAGLKKRKFMMDITVAEPLAAKIMEYFESGEPTLEGLTLLIMKGDAGQMPADPAAPMDGGEPPAEISETQEVAATAFKVTGLKKAKAVIGALEAWGEVKTERDALAKENRQLKHAQAVDKAIEEKRLAPAKRANALAMDPDKFEGAMSIASIIVDTETYTADTQSTKGKAADPKSAINDAMRRYCQETNQVLDEYAEYWVKNYPGEVFEW